MIGHLKWIRSLLAGLSRSGRWIFVCSLAIGLALGSASLVCLEILDEQIEGSQRGETQPTAPGEAESESRATSPEIADVESTGRSGSRSDGPAGEQREPVSGRTTQRSGEAESPKTRELETELEEISARHQGEYGILLWQPKSGTRVAVGAGERFKAASLAKLPVLLALYGEAAEGRIDLEERVRMSEADIQSGTGALQNLPPGTHLTLRECAEYLMRESDNTAWSMLENRLGEVRIRSELVAAGARSTNYEYAEHATTPEDTLKLLQRISDPGYTSPRHSREMLDSMVDTSFEGWLPQGVPEEARIAHKIGILGNNFSDAGIVFPPGEDSEKRYYVVVLSKETTEPAASDAMREISQAAYRELVDPEARPRSETPKPKLASRE